MATLTPKREAFCLGVAEGLTMLDAYTRAGYQPRALDATKQQAASRLLNSNDVASRISELRAPAAKKAQMTLESHLEDLQKLRNMAVKEKQYSAAITAEVARGKASGFYVDKLQHGGQVGITPVAPAELSPEQRAAMMRAIQHDI
jgi:phage terminase small subunit